MTRLRAAGARWRLLVHEPSGRSHDVTSAPARRAALTARLGTDPDLTRHTVLPGTEFDELVVGTWIHLEQMDVGRWWMNIGGVTVHVRADRDGRPRHVTVHGPGDYDDPHPGCTYQLDWTAS